MENSIARRPYHTAELATLLEFCRTYPGTQFPLATLELLMTRLVSSPDAVIDLAVDGERALVGVVIDTCENLYNSAGSEILGYRATPCGDKVLEFFLDLAETFAAKGPQSKFEVSTCDDAPMPRQLLERRGYQEAYRGYYMTRATGLPLTAPSRPFPAGFRWADYDSSYAEGLHELVRKAFEGIPGLQQSPSGAGETYASSRIQPRLLLDGSALVGFVFAVPDDSGDSGEIRTVALEPSYWGQGLGSFLLVEGMRVMAALGIETFHLSVVAVNERALALYYRYGFEVEKVDYAYHLELGG